MTLFDSLVAQGLRAYRKPRVAAADVMQLGVPREALAPAFLLVGVLSVLLNAAFTATLPEMGLGQSPFRALLFYMFTAVLFSFAVALVGKWFGGNGRFEDAFLLVVFLQSMMLPASAIQVLLALVSPNIAIVFMVAVYFFLLWVEVNFIAALHGFTSLGRAFFVVLIASFAVALLAAPFFAIGPMETPDV